MTGHPFGVLILLATLCGCAISVERTGPLPAAPEAPVSVPQTKAAGDAAAPATALAAGIAPAPVPATGISDAEGARRALLAFRISCPTLTRRRDQSGLTQPGDWAAACDTAARTVEADAVRFFEENFEPVQVGSGDAFATGYYEPEIAGSRTRQPGFEVPVYKRPDDLVDVDLGLFSEEMKGKRVRGRVDGRQLVPYADRAEIEKGALSGRGLEIAWAADPVEFFFLQIQGSGRLRLPDGSVMRIGYDGQNGRDYTGIGRLMRERGLLAPGQGSMQGIMAWLRANPEAGRDLMRENRSWIFFKELTGPGPLGALGLPVTGRASVAVDPAFVPLGAPVILAMDRPEPNGLWIAQDTGGAIKGANRFDTFWGAGEEARTLAGGMSARGKALILLPKGILARQRDSGRDAPAKP